MEFYNTIRLCVRVAMGASLVGLRVCVDMCVDTVYRASVGVWVRGPA